MSSLSADDRATIERAADAYVAAMNSADWTRVARSFSDAAVRIPPNEEPHEGRESIERWLGGIEELGSYELIRDRIDGADGIAYIRGRYAITLARWRSRPTVGRGRFLGDLAERVGRRVAHHRCDVEHAPPGVSLIPPGLTLRDIPEHWRS